MSLILTIVLPLIIAVVLVGLITLVIMGQRMLLDVAREQGLADGYKLKSQEDFDAKFYEDVKPFREAAEQAGCDMTAFDMYVAIRKTLITDRRANAQHFYQQRPGTPSDR